MSEILAQAQAAAQQRNWPLSNQYLRQVFSNESLAVLNPDQVKERRQQALPLALEVLEAGDFQDRWEVAKVFPPLQSVAVAPLLKILQDQTADWELQWFVTRILGHFDHSEVITALIHLLETAEDEELAAVAVAALANIGASAITVLSTLVQAESETSRFLAVKTLCQIRRSQTISPMLIAAADPQVTIRSMAIEALSSFHDPRVPPVLVKALMDPAAQVRQIAVSGLGMRSDLLQELRLVNLLAPLLEDLNLGVCQQAAIALGRLGTEAAAEALFRTLKSAHTPVPLQVTIVRALAWTPLYLDYLQQALAFDIAEVCQAAVIGLSQVEQPDLKLQAVKILLNSLNTQPQIRQNPSIKKSLCLGLGELGEPTAIPALINLLTDPDPAVKLHAIAGLKKLNPQAAQQLQALRQQADLSPTLKQGVIRALQEWQ